MPSPELLTGEVTVIFRDGDSLLIPPTALPREDRIPGETNEQTFRRLCEDHGVVGYVDYALQTGDIPRAPGKQLMAYVSQPRNGELEATELLIHKDDVIDHLKRHSSLPPDDKLLVKKALELLVSLDK